MTTDSHGAEDEAGDGADSEGCSSDPSDPDPDRAMSAGARQRMLREVRRGLLAEQKELSPKYFYDRRGSELFEEITGLPEYYLTRAEAGILEGAVQEWLSEFSPAALVELGAGSARKTRIVLDGMLRSRGARRTGAAVSGVTAGPSEAAIHFVPVDVSADFLGETARSLREEYPDVRIRPLVADMSAPGFLHADPSGPFLREELARPALFALLGSTIGNFRPAVACALLSRVRGVMKPPDSFLLGVDLRPGPLKPVERLEAAYDDAGGVTARFNLNVLRVLNRELGTDFDLSAFRHRAFYHAGKARIEMHLEARSSQRVTLPDGTRVEFRAGETLRTELSHKYERESVAALLRCAGMTLFRWLPGPEGLYAMAVAVPAPGFAGDLEQEGPGKTKAAPGAPKEAARTVVEERALP